jgi:14-3-3 protein epsilon
MSSERDIDLYMIQLLDQTDRYPDMVHLMKRVIASDPVLNADQRNLLSVAYKNIITGRRNGLRYLSGLLERDDTKSSEQRIAQVVTFQKAIVAELDQYCHELIGLVDSALLPASTDPEARVYYLKLKADYWRYISENKQGDEKAGAAQQAGEAYEAALAIASADIPPYTPTSLGLVLNYAVYLYEIGGKKQEAIDLAKKTHEECALTIGNNTKEAYTEATGILQLLNENVSIWSQGNQ